MNHKRYEQLLKKKENIEVTLPQAMSLMASDYYAYARLNLAMHFYNYYEIRREEAIPDCDVLFDKISSMMEESLFSAFDGKKREEAIKNIDVIRNMITATMQEFTEAADRLSIYEYMLNRIEKSYDNAAAPVDNEEAARKIYGAVFGDKDQVMIHERIRMMLAQLPVRMTRNHFFELLKSSFDVYEGNEKECLKDYMYMLRSAAGITTEDKKEVLPLKAFDKIKAVLDELSKKEYALLSKEEFLRLTERLNDCASLIRTYTDRFMQLQDIVNAFYILLLNQPYQTKEEDPCVSQLLSEIVKACKNDIVPDEEKLFALFEKTEGKLESLASCLLQDEAMLEQIGKSYDAMLDALMLREQFLCLSWSEKLCSNSAFVKLHNDSDVKECSQEFIRECYDSICTEIDALISSKNKLYNRAVIAAVLREMPVLFHTSEEVMDYIKNSLSGCHDMAEKSTGIELFFESIK